MASFLFQVGNLDLTQYVRVAPGEGLDPYDPDLIQLDFFENPLTEGGRLSSKRAGLAERAYPLFLNDDSPALLRALEQQVNRELDRAPGIQAQWRPPGSTSITFIDLEAGRFEPDYSLRRDEHGWLGGILRLWTQPYGHTATERLIATAAGTGVAMVVPIPSALNGDAEALPIYRVRQGSQIAPHGRVIAVAPLPHASYRAVVPAGGLSNIATLVGASGAHASQYARIHAAGAPATWSMGAASLYAGHAHRILAVARGDVELTAFDHQGDPIGVGAIASVGHPVEWGVVDLGVWRPPDDLAIGTPVLGVAAARPSPWWHGGAAGDGASAAHITALFICPEKGTDLVFDRQYREVLDDDSFDVGGLPGPLEGRFAREGHRWDAAPHAAVLGSLPFRVIADLTDRSAQPYSPTNPHVLTRFANTLVGPGMPSMVQGRIETLWAAGSQRIVANPNAIAGVHLTAPSPVIGQVESDVLELIGNASGAVLRNVFVVAGGTLVGTQVFLASRALDEFKLTMNRGPQFWGAVEAGGSLHASITLMEVDSDEVRLPGVHCQATSANGAGEAFHLQAFRALINSQNGHGANDHYVLDGVRRLSRRETSASAYSRSMADRSRGAELRLAPSAPAIAVFGMPFDRGIANDTLSVEVRVRERFRFAR